jgi:hypothetical protein
MGEHILATPSRTLYTLRRCICELHIADVDLMKFGIKCFFSYAALRFIVYVFPVYKYAVLCCIQARSTINTSCMRISAPTSPAARCDAVTLFLQCGDAVVTLLHLCRHTVVPLCDIHLLGAYQIARNLQITV